MASLPQNAPIRLTQRAQSAQAAESDTQTVVAPLIASKSDAVTASLHITHAQIYRMMTEILQNRLQLQKYDRQELKLLKQVLEEINRIRTMLTNRQSDEDKAAGKADIKNRAHDKIYRSFVSLKAFPGNSKWIALQQPISIEKDCPIYQKCLSYYEKMKDSADGTFGYLVTHPNSKNAPEFIPPEDIKAGKIPLWLFLDVIEAFSTLHPKSSDARDNGTTAAQLGIFQKEEDEYNAENRVPLISTTSGVGDRSEDASKPGESDFVYPLNPSAEPNPFENMGCKRAYRSSDLDALQATLNAQVEALSNKLERLTQEVKDAKLNYSSTGESLTAKIKRLLEGIREAQRQQRPVS